MVINCDPSLFCILNFKANKYKRLTQTSELTFLADICVVLRDE